MKIECEYCGCMVDEKLSSCPGCGAPLNGVRRFAEEQPQTIEQLKEWYVQHNLPPEEVTRFFIGKNITEPRAFGIYRDSNGDYVVYKNKSNGERAIRYRGTDEGYAVNELYQRLRIEIADQKERSEVQNSSRNVASENNNRKGLSSVARILLIVLGSFVVIRVATLGMWACVYMSAIFDDSPSEGYYSYGGKNYYYQDSSWYGYDQEEDDWYEMDSESVPEAIESDSDEYYNYSNQHEGKDFEDSEWYEEDYDYDYDYDDDDDYDRDWDDDSDWDDYDSWDSGGSDWDSDW